MAGSCSSVAHPVRGTTFEEAPVPLPSAGRSRQGAAAHPLRAAAHQTGLRSRLERLRLALVLSLMAGVASLGAPALAAAEGCPNEAFRTGPSEHLPDCRAYEQVTPLSVAGGAVADTGVSPEGSTLLMSSFNGFSGQAGGAGFIHSEIYSMTRTEAGWVTTADNPPSSEYSPFVLDNVTYYDGANLDGRITAWMGRRVGEPDNSVSFFETLPGGSVVDVGPGIGPDAPAGETRIDATPANLSAVGISDDASRLLFEIEDYFWPFDATQYGHGIHSLYEYAGTGNTTPMLVGVDNEGQQISQCGTVLGGGSPTGGAANGLINSSHNAMSADGETVFFTAFPPDYHSDGCTGTGPPVAELFARIGNGEPDAHTVAISEPTTEDCTACDTRPGVLSEAFFLGASADGSKVFF